MELKAELAAGFDKTGVALIFREADESLGAQRQRWPSGQQGAVNNSPAPTNHTTTSTSTSTTGTSHIPSSPIPVPSIPSSPSPCPSCTPEHGLDRAGIRLASGQGNGRRAWPERRCGRWNARGARGRTRKPRPSKRLRRNCCISVKMLPLSTVTTTSVARRPIHLASSCTLFDRAATLMEAGRWLQR